MSLDTCQYLFLHEYSIEGFCMFVQLFLSNDMLYAWVWHRLVSVRPSLNDPIKHGGMENADIFYCLAPHHGAFLFQKDAGKW